jgi:hypothetical protein
VIITVMRMKMNDCIINNLNNYLLKNKLLDNCKN